jgi:hypothetical protein
MNFTFTVGPWIVPAAITAVLWIVALLIALRDLSSCRGDYSFPFTGFLGVVVATIATAAVWAAFLLIQLFN